MYEHQWSIESDIV